MWENVQPWDWRESPEACTLLGWPWTQPRMQRAEAQSGCMSTKRWEGRRGERSAQARAHSSPSTLKWIKNISPNIALLKWQQSLVSQDDQIMVAFLVPGLLPWLLSQTSASLSPWNNLGPCFQQEWVLSDPGILWGTYNLASDLLFLELSFVQTRSRNFSSLSSIFQELKVLAVRVECSWAGLAWGPNSPY